MPMKITMPKLGLTMEEAQIVEWRKKEGERVEKGEVLFVIETEKVTFEVEAEEAGVVGKIVSREGDVLPVGGLVGYLTVDGEPSTVAAPETPSEPAPAAPEEASAPSQPARGTAGAGEAVRISPAARKMARDLGIDPSTLAGTGPGGRVVVEDVVRASEARKRTTPVAGRDQSTEADETVVPLSPLRAAVSRRMTESFQAPHFYMAVEADAQALLDTREALVAAAAREGTTRPTVTDLLVKLVARVLEEHPALNSAYADGSVRRLRRIHIGVATAVEGGLVVPVIRDANRKSLAEVAAARSDIVARTRDRKVTADEISGSTFTITNIGMWGIDSSAAIINPPEAAILSVGAIKEQVTPRAGKAEIRPMMKLTVSLDHRVLDGSDGAAFLNAVKRYIEDPRSAGL